MARLTRRARLQTQARSPEEQAQTEVLSELERAVQALAAEWGPAPGAKNVSTRREVTLWGQRDPKVDFESLKQQLMATGLGQTPDLLDPEGDGALAVIQEHPDMAPLFMEPVAEDVADVLATLAEFPFRLAILLDLEDDPEAMVAKAESLDRAWMKEMGRTEMDGTVTEAASTPSQPAPPPAAQAPPMPMQPAPPMIPPTMPLPVGG
jgi:hypothetical protein